MHARIESTTLGDFCRRHPGNISGCARLLFGELGRGYDAEVLEFFSSGTSFDVAF